MAMKLPARELARQRLADIGQADDAKAIEAEAAKIRAEKGRTEEEDKAIEREYNAMMNEAKKRTSPPKKKAKAKQEPEKAEEPAKAEPAPKHPGGRPLKGEGPRKIISLRLPEDTLRKILLIKARIIQDTERDLTNADVIIKLVSDYYNNM